jgi:hypothetical protein
MEYTTQRGITVDIRPIPLLLDEVRKANPLPDAPTYTEKLAGGATQDVEITDADALAWARNDPDTWAPHAERWATYIQERDAAQGLLNDRIWLAVMRRAIVVEMPKDDAWVAEQEELGLTVPASPQERRLHYIRTEVIGGMADIWKITAIANGADLSEEALQLAEASFRHSLARTLLAGLADKAGAVAAGSAGRAHAGGEGVETAAE